jgi:hypothetical protein
MITEAEAKTKWCPFARPGAYRPDDCGEVRGNRMMDGVPDSGALCVGSACMAWREGEAGEELFGRDREGLKPLEDCPKPEGDGWRPERSQYMKRDIVENFPSTHHFTHHWLRKVPTGSCGLVHSASPKTGA